MQAIEIRLQQLYKSTRRKIDDLPAVRVRLARFERERRMGFKMANVMLESVALNVQKDGPGSGCERCYSPDFCRCDEAYS